MSTHTPGPWIFNTTYDSDGGNVTDKSGRYIACCDGCDIPGTSGEVSVAEAKANAQLIAAAPDLLEALVYARDEIAMRVEEDGGNAYSVKKACRKIDEAIAKAEGCKVKP